MTTATRDISTRVKLAIDQDTFVRANTTASTTITSGWGTASSGSAWSSAGAGETFQISSNEGTVTGVGGNSYALLGSRTVKDGEALVRFSVDALSSAAGVLLRYTDANNHYRVRYASSAIAIVVNNAGVTTSLATVSVTVSINTFYWLRARVIGNTLYGKLWQDGTTEPTAFQVQATDTTFTGANKVGLYSKPNAGTNVVKYDSFAFYDAAATLRDIAVRLRIGQGRDLATRTRVQGQSQRDIATRVRPQGQPLRDLPMRANMQGRPQRDLPTRVRSQGQPQRDLPTRVRSQGQPQRDITTRSRIGQGRDLSTRVRSQGQLQRDLSTRVRPQGQPVRDISIRVRSQGQSQRDIATRASMQGQPQRDLSTRVRSQGRPLRDLSTRVRSQGQPQRDLPTRVRSQGQPQRDLSTRIKTQGQPQRDLGTRVLMGLARDLGIRLRTQSQSVRDLGTRVRLAAPPVLVAYDIACRIILAPNPNQGIQLFPLPTPSGPAMSGLVLPLDRPTAPYQVGGVALPDTPTVCTAPFVQGNMVPAGASFSLTFPLPVTSLTLALFLTGSTRIFSFAVSGGKRVSGPVVILSAVTSSQTLVVTLQVTTAITVPS